MIVSSEQVMTKITPTVSASNCSTKLAYVLGNILYITGAGQQEVRHRVVQLMLTCRTGITCDGKC